MSIATFRFADELSLFLAPQHRGHRFVYDTARAATLKNAIEALGVPHTEVGAITVNASRPRCSGRCATATRSRSRLTVRPSTEPCASWPTRISAALRARFLRMLGFDTLHDPRWSDAEIRRLAHDDDRIVLTRDRDLLKCRDISRGAYVRAIKPEAQLQEVAQRYRLGKSARPFTLCLSCNVPLQSIAKAEVADRIPPKVREHQQLFTHCSACGRVFWPGTHYERMKEALVAALPYEKGGHS